MTEPSSQRGPHHEIFARSGPLVVLFSGTNKLDHAFDFWGYAQRSRASIILLNNGSNRWYQGGVPGFGDSVADTAALIRRWAEHLSPAEICCIGASMGGSAAVMYGSLVDARVLAFSFEAHIRHVGSRSIKYIPEDYPLAYPDLTPLITASKRPITSLLGGDDIIDLAEASRLMTIPNLQLSVLRGVDHGVPRHLRINGKLDAVLDAFVAGRQLPPLEEEDDDLDAPGYMAAIEASHLAYGHGRPLDSLVDAERACALRPFSFAARLLAGRALMKLKRPAEALSHLGLAVSLTTGSSEARLLLGRALRSMGRLRHAAAYHAATHELFPQEHRVLYDLSLALWSMGDHARALKQLETACQMAPKNTAYAQKKEQLLESMKAQRT